MKLPTLVVMMLMPVIVLSQSKQQAATLCALKGKVAEGDHLSVAVTGVNEGGMGDSGPAMGVLEDTTCPDQNAWVATKH